MGRKKKSESTPTVITRRAQAPPGEIVFKTPADRVKFFFENFLVHVKGPLGGKPFKLSDWQVRDIINPIYSTLNPDGTRQYRTVYAELPRKQGKSLIASGLALYHLLFDREPGPECISASATRDMASLVFDAARQMVLHSPRLRKVCKIYRKAIEGPNGGIYRTISGDANTSHGLNPNLVIADEIHTMGTSDEFWQTLTTSMVSRSQPLVFGITTPGWDKNSLAYRLHCYSKTVMEARKKGEEIDPSWYSIMYGAPPEMPWDDPKTWAVANPGLGASVSLSMLENAAREAKENPSKQTAFEILHLGRWVSSESPWFSAAKLEECFVDEEDWPDFTGQQAWLAMDLSSTSDLTSVAVCHEKDGIFWLDVHSWAPAGALKTREKANRTRYQPWSPQFITITQGEVVDQDQIKAHVQKLGQQYELRDVTADPWNAVPLLTALESEGFPVSKFIQGFLSLSPAIKDFEVLAFTRKLKIRRNPAFAWSFGNVKIVMDHAENRKISKQASTDKVDPIVAAVMALARCRAEMANGPSAYEGRGLDVF